MVKKSLKVLVILFINFMVAHGIYAASAYLSPSSTNVTVGDTVTISMGIKDSAAWELKASYSNGITLTSGDLNLADASSNAKNISKVINTLTFKADKVGTYTVNLAGNVTDQDDKTSNVSAKATIVVKEKAVVPETPPTPEPPINNEKTPPTLSSNARLQKLLPSVEGLSPEFSPAQLNYTLTVKENVNDLIINTTTEETGATVYVEGHLGLKVGENKITITVTAPDKKTKKVYTINVMKSNNPELADATLSNLIIENVTLNQEFSKEITEYSCSVSGADVDSLTILTFTSNNAATVEVIGNENLKIGENVITIKVTSENKEVIKEYTLKVVKEGEVTEETDGLITLDGGDVSTWDKIRSFFRQSGLMVLLFAMCLVELAQIIYLYLIVRKVDNKMTPKKGKKQVDFFDEKEESTKRRGRVEPAVENIENESREQISILEQEQEDPTLKELVDSVNITKNEGTQQDSNEAEQKEE